MWLKGANATQRGVEWQFNIDDTHLKLKRLYPKLRLEDALPPLIQRQQSAHHRDGGGDCLGR